MFLLDNFFDSAIYIIIVVVAALLVLIAIATLSGMSKPKRKNVNRRNLLTAGQKEHREKTKLLQEPEKEKRHEGKRKQDKRKEDKRRREKQEDDEPIEVLTVAADDSGRSTGIENNEVIDLPELPSADNIEEDEEEIQEEPKSEDLMNVFQVDEVEDTYASDLAANLFDVDLSSLEKLSKEVLEVYSGKRKEENKEE